MRARLASSAVAGLVAVILAVGGGPDSPEPTSVGCRPDAKLIGAVAVYGTGSGSWWEITRDGFDAAGVSDYQAFIEGALGTEFASLDDAITALSDAVAAFDFNGNGMVCAYGLRGTRTSLGDPNYAYYLFTVRDDGHDK